MGLLRRLFGTKKQPVNSDGSGAKPAAQKKRWNFVKSSKENSQLPPSYSSRFNGLNSPSTFSGVFSDSLDANKHAIAVAAATAAVAEAALAAAHAAAEVVRLTNGTGGARSASSEHVSNNQRMLVEIVAAVKIQSAFRGYLARRALRALKALVKLQALVKGHIVRKQTADMFRRMQTLVRLQFRLRANRMHLAENLHSSMSSLSHFPNDDWEHSDHGYVSKLEGPSILKTCSSNSSFRGIDSAGGHFNKTWLDRWMEENLWINRRDTSLKAGHAEDSKSDKILEVDTWKPHLNSQLYDKSSHSSLHGLASDYSGVNLPYYNSPSKSSRKQINPSVSSKEVPSFSQNFPKGKEDAASWTAENIPAFSTSSRPGGVARRTPFSPTKSECSWGFFNGYSGYPNYMANTESSRAKARSLSAPRQRLECERYVSTRMSLQGSRDTDFRNKAYPTSSHLNNRPRSTNLR